jgi:hypothetical protein
MPPFLSTFSKICVYVRRAKFDLLICPNVRFILLHVIHVESTSSVTAQFVKRSVPCMTYCICVLGTDF